MTVAFILIIVIDLTGRNTSLVQSSVSSSVPYHLLALKQKAKRNPKLA